MPLIAKTAIPNSTTIYFSYNSCNRVTIPAETDRRPDNCAQNLKMSKRTHLWRDLSMAVSKTDPPYGILKNDETKPNPCNQRCDMTISRISAYVPVPRRNIHPARPV